MVREVSIAAAVLLSIAIAVPSEPNTLAVTRGAEPATQSSSTERVEASPLRFEPNVGQLPIDISFAARGRGYDVAIGRSGAVSLAGADSPLVQMRFVGARASGCAGDERLPGVSNYLLGRDQSRWRTGVPGFGRVRINGVYPGIDVAFYGSRGALEYDLVLAPGADPRAIEVEIQGASSVVLSDDGAMLVSSPGGTFRHAAPAVYQDLHSGRRRIAGRYVARGPRRIGFEVADFDRSLPLVVDPVVTYSTLLYGDGYEYGTDIAVDATGHAYVTGYTESATFPTTGTSVQPFHRGPSDAFVTKFAPNGKTVVYSTFVGGSSNDIGYGIAADALGNAYVTGMTLSGDFPAINAPQATLGGGPTDAFVMKLDPSGSAILFSTFFGGAGSDYGESIAADAAGNAYLGGTSEANVSTTTGAFQPTRPVGDATNIPFVAVLDTTKSGAGALRYATYLGGSQGIGVFTSDIAVTGIAPGPGGLVYVAGNTLQVDFPTTPNAVQPSPVGEQVNKDGFFAVLDRGRPGSAGLQYGTRLGGSGRDTLEGLAVDWTGMAYVAGTTVSPDFPTTAGSYQPAVPVGGRSDGFVAKIDPTRSGPAGLFYSTYLGGTDTDEIMDVGVDAAGRAYVTGNTASNDFPTHDSLNSTSRLAIYLDGIVAVVAPGGDALVSSSQFGGRELSRGLGLAVDPAGDAYVLAIPGPGFPTTPGAFQASPGNRGASAIAVVKITVPGGACELSAPQDVAAVATTLLEGRAGGLVDYPLPSASGAGCGSSFVTCDPQPGAFMEVGTTRVVCWATTPAGITSEASFDIQVSLPADLCAKLSDGGSTISVVSDPANSLYGYWAFGGSGGQYGPPTRVENIPGRRFVIEGSLSAERHFWAKYNYRTQRWKVIVWDEDDEYPSVYRAHGSVCSEGND